MSKEFGEVTINDDAIEVFLTEDHTVRIPSNLQEALDEFARRAQELADVYRAAEEAEENHEWKEGEPTPLDFGQLAMEFDVFYRIFGAGLEETVRQLAINLANFVASDLSDLVDVPEDVMIATQRVLDSAEREAAADVTSEGETVH